MLLESDKYFLLADFGSYVDTQAEITKLYTQEREWNRKSVLNVARIGRFSSDRTVREYAHEIWGLDQLSPLAIAINDCRCRASAGDPRRWAGGFSAARMPHPASSRAES